ncbi:Senp8 [Symbiodinium microadriaticum]|nr:Senp8 [Symbiodinium microadriaticum]
MSERRLEDDIEEITVRIGALEVAIRGDLAAYPLPELSDLVRQLRARCIEEPSSAPGISSTTTQSATPSPLKQKVKLIFEEPGDNGQLQPDRPLPTLHLFLSSDGDDEQARLARAALVKIRPGGFLVILPVDERITEGLLNIVSEDGDPVVLDSEAQVEMETVRGRSLGTMTVVMADIPWEGVGAFTAVHPARGALAREVRVLPFNVGSTSGRPRTTSALSAAATWIRNVMDAETAAEYLTAEEFAGDEAVAEEEAPELEPAQASVTELLTRLQQLESRVGAGVAPTPAPGLGGPSLLRAPPAGGLDADGLARLRSLAGPAPKRVPKAAAAPPALRAGDTIHRETELEVLPAAEAEDPFAEATSENPLHQILAAQLEQTRLMMERLAPQRSLDSVAAALGSGSASGSGESSGVRGCMARDAFLRQVQDLERVADIAQTNALRELGLDSAEPNLLKLFVERRMPLANLKTLGYIASFAAEGWELGHRLQNRQLQGFAARLAMLCEQASLDGGRLQLAWLLGGFAEPPPAMWLNTRRSGVKPFSSLAHPSWIAGNIAYLRDVDYLETRMSNLGKDAQRRSSTEEADPEAAAASTWKPRRKPKAKALASACWMLTLLHAEPHEGWRFYAADLSDFYHSFRISKEGCLYDCIELGGSGSWAQTLGSFGLTLHPLSCSSNGASLLADLSGKTVARDLIGLAARRVVREWHISLTCFTDSPLKRPRRRTACMPAGVSGCEKETAADNRLARVAVWILATALSCGQYVSVQLPAGGCSCERGQHFSAAGARFDEVPRWLQQLLAGDWRSFDLVVEASCLKKIPARWLRFLLLLGGDIERNPGPRIAVKTPRGPLDLEQGFAPSTMHKMRKALEALELWLLEVAHLSLEQALSTNEGAELALRGFGLHLYAEGHPRYLLVYAITAIQNRCPSYRNRLSAAWQVDKKWQDIEPGECRPVLPAAAVRALLCVTALWGWLRWSGLVLVGFLAMLHPTEMVQLLRKDLVFPSDALGHTRALYVHLRKPKTQRFARRQHGKIDDPIAIRILEALFGQLAPHERLFAGSMHSFRKLWDAGLQFLGIPCRAIVKGATPGVLRGSGATFFYQATENVQWLAWRGRWARVRTLEYYLQEVAAQLLLTELGTQARYRIAAFDSACDAVLCSLSGATQ